MADRVVQLRFGSLRLQRRKVVRLRRVAKEAASGFGASIAGIPHLSTSNPPK